MNTRSNHLPAAARAALTALAALGALCLSVGAAPAAAQGYSHYLVGNAADHPAPPPPAQGAMMLMGGGPDVDDAFRWMLARAAGGDVVVLRASGSDGYNSYLYDMGGVDSVETLVVRTRSAAADPFVVERVQRAEALFIAGGDQADYIKLWKDTPLHAAILELIARRVVVGGTSAGLAVLGEVDYSASRGSITSAEALANPYDRLLTLDRGFVTLPGLGGTVTDSHFRERDRMGRLMSFVARTLQDGWITLAAARGIGIDEHTALVVEGSEGLAMGSGGVYLLRPTSPPALCARRKPLSFRNVSVDRLRAGARFDIVSWTSTGGTRYELSAESGRLLSTQANGAVY